MYITKQGSFSKVLDPATAENQLGDLDDEDLEEMDPRAFRVHGKTFRFCRTSLNCLDNRNSIRKF